jgi:hypothetical protein
MLHSYNIRSLIEYNDRVSSSLCALDKVPLFDNRWSLNLFRLDGRYCRLMMVWSQMSVHVVIVVIVFVTDVRSAVYILVRIVGVFHHTVRVIVLMIRLVIGTGNLLFGCVFLAARVRWPTRSGLPVGPQSAGANVRFLATVTGERSLVGMDALVQF